MAKRYTIINGRPLHRGLSVILSAALISTSWSDTPRVEWCPTAEPLSIVMTQTIPGQGFFSHRILNDSSVTSPAFSLRHLLAAALMTSFLPISLPISAAVAPQKTSRATKRPLTVSPVPALLSAIDAKRTAYQALEDKLFADFDFKVTINSDIRAAFPKSSRKLFTILVEAILNDHSAQVSESWHPVLIAHDDWLKSLADLDQELHRTPAPEKSHSKKSKPKTPTITPQERANAETVLNADKEAAGVSHPVPADGSLVTVLKGQTILFRARVHLDGQVELLQDFARGDALPNGEFSLTINETHKHLNLFAGEGSITSTDQKRPFPPFSTASAIKDFAEDPKAFNIENAMTANGAETAKTKPSPISTSSVGVAKGPELLWPWYNVTSDAELQFVWAQQYQTLSLPVPSNVDQHLHQDIAARVLTLLSTLTGVSSTDLEAFRQSLREEAFRASATLMKSSTPAPVLIKRLDQSIAQSDDLRKQFQTDKTNGSSMTRASALILQEVKKSDHSVIMQSSWVAGLLVLSLFAPGTVALVAVVVGMMVVVKWLLSKPIDRTDTAAARREASYFLGKDLLRYYLPGSPRELIAFGRLMNFSVEPLLADFMMYDVSSKEFNLTAIALMLNHNLLAYREIRAAYETLADQDSEKANVLRDVMRVIQYNTLLHYDAGDADKHPANHIGLWSRFKTSFIQSWRHVNRRTWPGRSQNAMGLVIRSLKEFRLRDPKIVLKVHYWSGGTLPLELAQTLDQEHLDSISITAFDKWLDYHIAAHIDPDYTLIFNDDGQLVQTVAKSDGTLWIRWTLATYFVALVRRPIEKAMQAVSGVSFGERESFINRAEWAYNSYLHDHYPMDLESVSLLDPEAERYAENHPSRLRFEKADLFDYPASILEPHADLIWVDGFLHRIRPYFKDGTILNRLKALGETVHADGVVINSITGILDQPQVSYIDFYERKGNRLILNTMRSHGYTSYANWELIPFDLINYLSPARQSVFHLRSDHPSFHRARQLRNQA